MQYKIPTCKLCGRKGHYKYQCFENPKRKQALKRKYSEYKTGKTPKRDKTLSSQNLERKKLILELDKYCSLIVRISSSDKFGVATCYTCQKRFPYKTLDNGHFKSRRYIGTRFDFDNMRPQCQYCNRVLRGNLDKYKSRLAKEIGPERFQNLDIQKMKKITTPELEELLADIKIRYKKLIESKKQEQTR